jgi:hypothetical protein
MTLIKQKKGVQSYLSWQQGVDATVKTLTGQSAKQRGYTDIVKALVGGTTSNADFLKLMQASSWDAGRYGAPGGASSSASTNNSSSTSRTSITGWGNVNGSSLSDLQAAARARFANATSGSGGAGGSSINTYHFGAVTISVNGAGDSKAVAAEIAKQIKKLGTS